MNQVDTVRWQNQMLDTSSLSAAKSRLQLETRVTCLISRTYRELSPFGLVRIFLLTNHKFPTILLVHKVNSLKKYFVQSTLYNHSPTLIGREF